MKILKGDVIYSGCDILVNPVNCVGIMGAGLAKQFKIKFPKYFEQYVKLCKDKILSIGKPQLYIDSKNEISILSFPTKNHYSENSKIDYIRKGLSYVKDNYCSFGISTSIAFPLLGCGLGGLDPLDVLCEISLFDVDVENYNWDIYVYIN